MNLTDLSISIIVGYLLGCFQSAFFIGKFFEKIDIREHGSNNAGASNVTNVMGWKYGILTAVFDILKGFLAVVLIRALYQENEFLYFIAGISSIIGHIYPIFLRFRGGKGVATLIGMTLAFKPILGIIIILFLVSITIVFDYIALGSVVIFTILPIGLYMYGYSFEYILISILLTLISYHKHRSNIKNIIEGNETGLREVFTRGKNKKNKNIATFKDEINIR